jgi:hypothetical protein
MEELGDHGLRPLERTPPALVRDALNDLYTFELRRLRARLLRREFPKASYAGLVASVRRRYPLLSIPVQDWLEPDATGPEPPRDPWRGNYPCR